jgi:hypothetical protein
MSTPHRATEEQWEIVEICREEGHTPWPTATCLLELRARVEALEREVVVDQPEPAPLATDQDLYQLFDQAEPTFPDGFRAIYDLGRQHGAQPAPATEKSSAPAPAGSLVERVMVLLGHHGDGTARAAIREVAAWLRSEYPRREGYGTAWANLIEQEASR